MIKPTVKVALPLLFILAIGSSSCSWYEPARVESDFGNSVRTMVAQQIHDPAVAHEPAIFGPPSILGESAASAVLGYGTATAEARIERERKTGSPIPIVGIVSE